MLNFIGLTLDDIEKIRPYFLFSANKGCDNTAGIMFMWRHFLSAQYALWNNTLVFKCIYKPLGNKVAFTYPLGDDVPGCIDELEYYCKCNNIPLSYYMVTKEELSALKSLYENVHIHQNSGWSDYLYNAGDIVNLAGRRYHGQRNHINRFIRLYPDYVFEVITHLNIGEVISFYEKFKSGVHKEASLFAEEQKITAEVLENYRSYRLIGGLLRINGRVAAFSIGEIQNDVLFIHIEKADTSFIGIYPVICNEFAKHFCTGDVLYINREDDAGDPGLRISKQSYHPVELIDKYIVEVFE